MKQLIALVILLAVVGIVGSLYRHALERPNGLPGGIANCTLEARVCPDGTSVGRQGPDCSFAACPLPNVEVPEAGIAFALPAGYAQILAGAPAQDTLRIFSKPSASPSVQHSIHVSRYPIPEGQTVEAVILSNTRFQPADMPAENMSRFTTIEIAGRTYRAVVIERFEGLVESAYFLARESDVLRFSIVEHDVTDWTNPDLVIDELPEHQALRRLLGTLQTY